MIGNKTEQSQRYSARSNHARQEGEGKSTFITGEWSVFRSDVDA